MPLASCSGVTEAQIDQAAVRAALAAVGGYWRPSAGAIRLLEELGEVAEAIASGEVDALADELADVWIISTAVADQYLAAVDPLGAGARQGDQPAGAAAVGGGAEPNLETAAAPDHAPPALAGLITTAGTIARIVNHYDGPKTPKRLEGWVGLQPAMRAFHAELRALADAHRIDLAAVVGGKLAVLIERDRGRFAPSYDASTAPILARVRAAHPGLGQARLLGAPDWDPASADRAADAAIAAITTFVKAGDPEDLHGLLIPAPAGLAGVALAGWWGELAARARHAGWGLDPASVRATVVESEPESRAADVADPFWPAASGAFAVVQRRATISTSTLSRVPWWEPVSG